MFSSVFSNNIFNALNSRFIETLQRHTSILFNFNETKKSLIKIIKQQNKKIRVNSFKELLKINKNLF